MKTWGKLAVLALLVFLFSGCGGGGSNTATNDTIYGWDTDRNIAQTPNQDMGQQDTTPIIPTPTPEDNTQYTEPDDTSTITPSPESEIPTPTPPITENEDTTPYTPTPEPSPYIEPDSSTYIDTYDIASALEGTWNGISGSGMVTNTDTIIGLLMSHMSISFTQPQIAGDRGTTYITQEQYWDYTDGEQTYQASLDGDKVQNSITHIGADTWQLNTTDNTTTTITLTSETTAEVTQDGTVKIDGYLWQYHINYVLHKEGNYDPSALYGNWETATPYNAGIGTATSGIIGRDYDTLELRVSSAKISFSEGGITHDINFGAYRDSVYINSASPIYPREIVSVQQLDNDTFTYRLKGFDTNTNSPSSASSVTVTIKLTSDVTAEINETGHFRLYRQLYTYNVFYRLTKR
jgi:hypothetical protein